MSHSMKPVILILPSSLQETTYMIPHSRSGISFRTMIWNFHLIQISRSVGVSMTVGASVIAHQMMDTILLHLHHLFHSWETLSLSQWLHLGNLKHATAAFLQE